MDAFTLDETKSESVEYILKKYFIERMDVSNVNKKFVLLNNKNNNVVYSLTNESRLWKEEPTFPENNAWIQAFQIRKPLLAKVNAHSSGKPECNIGFVGIFKENYGFKIKNLLNTRNNPGALCDQTDKQKLITKINEFQITAIDFHILYLTFLSWGNANCYKILREVDLPFFTIYGCYIDLSIQEHIQYI
jgi:hypothetical protein